VLPIKPEGAPLESVGSQMFYVYLEMVHVIILKSE